MSSLPSVVVLGASGMLGHRLLLTLEERGYHTIGTYRDHPCLLEAEEWARFSRILDRLKVDVVINCIGWVRQRPFAGRQAEAIYVNAAFPHLVSAYCERRGIELVHISTDCVQDGDWYGLSKKLGEAIGYGLVLRTSFVGHELSRRCGLLEWVLAQRGAVNGYARARWNGLTTNELASIIGRIVLPNLAQMRGRIWEVCGPEITKCELLQLINQIYQCGLSVLPVDEPASDRRLDGRHFNERFGYLPPSWQEMLERMKRDRPAAGGINYGRAK